MNVTVTVATAMPLPPPKGGGVAGSKWWQWQSVAVNRETPGRCLESTAIETVAERGSDGSTAKLCHGPNGSERRVVNLTTDSDIPSVLHPERTTE